MKKLIAIAGLISSFLIFMPLPLSAQVLGNARLSFIQGDVAIRTKDMGTQWGAASTNTPLTSGTKLWIPENGRAEVQFLGGSYLRAGENTGVDFTDLKMDGQDNIIQVSVSQGRTYIYYAGSNAKNSVFQVDTQMGSTKTYGASKFKVDVYDNGYTEVSVLSGAVYVETQNGSTKVDAGSMLSIGVDQTAEISPLRAADSWDRWNQARDSALAKAGPSREYLPTALDAYSNDFDAYGRWMNTPEYGYVWTPTVDVDRWAPYRIGRWCWIGGDYVWVSYEPWGWVPYHYGRWAFIGSVGWCWVPPVTTAVYWCPGFVAWAWTPSYVSWVPLAPGEIYYGFGYYGPRSVNITNININRINITNVYANANITNAVTVVNRETFLTGTPARIGNASTNPFTAGDRISVGRPQITPAKATALPNPLKVVPERALPPRTVLTRAAQIEGRPVGVDPNVSVFKRGQRTSSMHINRIEHPRTTTEVQKPELRQPPVRREVRPSPAQKEEKGGPAVQREFGIAPPHKEEQRVPPARREQIERPSVPSKVPPQAQSPQSLTPKREPMGPPPVQRRELGPPPVQSVEPGGPSTQREFGIAPSHGGELQGTPPTSREEINKPSPPVHRRGDRGEFKAGPFDSRERREER